LAARFIEALPRFAQLSTFQAYAQVVAQHNLFPEFANWIT